MGAREELDALSASLDGLAASASAYARAALAAWDGENPGADRAERASFAAELLMGVSGAFGAQAAESAMGFLAALSVEPGDASPSVAAAYAARKGAWVASLDGEAALGAVGDTAESYVRRDAFEASARACDRAGVRWARVPTGGETCAFCFMLASRGYVYTSEQAARGGMGMHAHCDCKVVPETAGKIEGYDPDGLYRRWRMCADAVAADPDATGQDSLRAIMREVERRDWEWVWTGKSGTATLGTRDIKPHEFDAYRVLISHGFSFEVNPVIEANRRSGKSSPDMTMGGSRWELKCPSGSNPKKTIGRNLNKAISQMLNANPPVSSVNVVLSCLETPLSKQQVERIVELKMSEGRIDELLVIYSESEIRRYKK